MHVSCIDDVPSCAALDSGTQQVHEAVFGFVYRCQGSRLLRANRLWLVRYYCGSLRRKTVRKQQKARRGECVPRAWQRNVTLSGCPGWLSGSLP